MKRLFIILPGIRILSGLAFALAVYLAWQKALPGCGEGSGCDAVLSSRWARFWKIPVGALGAVIYLAILVVSMTTSAYEPPSRNRGRWSALLTLGLAAAGGAVWLIAVQALVLRRFCAYCMVDHVLGLGTLALIIYGVRQGQPAGGRSIPVGRIAIAAIAAVVIFIAGQIVLVPRMHQVQGADEIARRAPSSDDSSLDDSSPPAIATRPVLPSTSPAIAAATRPAGRSVKAIRGVVAVDMSLWPVVGPMDAPHVVLDLFDYTCPHCRELHKMMQRARARYGSELAVVTIPVPLNANCNVVIRKTQDRHKDACTLAMYALAVWKAAPNKFLQYDYWLFDPKDPPSTLLARDQAELLVGRDEFAAALADPSVEQRIYDGVDIYRNIGGGAIPKLIFPEAVVTWPINSDKYLYEIFESQLEIKPVVGGNQ